MIRLQSTEPDLTGFVSLIELSGVLPHSLENIVISLTALVIGYAFTENRVWYQS
jgi:hypothetical protein